MTRNWIARIPWLPAPISNKELQNSELFQEWMVARSDNGRLGLQLQWLVNRIFPYYLPKRYHAMDCRALLESSDDQFWDNATFFLVCTQGHGIPFLKHVSQNLTGTQPNLKGMAPIFKDSSRREFLKPAPDECTSAREFLLEPWILVQLPFNPILLQQWLAAACAENILFKTRLARLACIEFTAEVNHLLELSRSLLRGLEFFSMELDKQFDDSLCSDEKSVNVEAFTEKLSDVLYILDFVTSKNLIEQLKMQTECPSRDGNLDEPKETDHPSLDRLFVEFENVIPQNIYSIDFWKRPNLGRFFLSIKSQGILRDIAFEKSQELLSRQSQVAELIDFIDKKFIQTGKLRVNKEVLATYIQTEDTQNRLYLGAFYSIFKMFFSSSSYSDGICKKDTGVIVDLIRLYSDLQMTWSLEAIAVFLSKTFNLKVWRKNDALLIDLPCAESLQSKWKFDQILNSIKAECEAERETAKQLCSAKTSKRDPEATATTLQAAIKNLVFKMISGSYKLDQRPKRTFYPEWPFVQYLLPCLVASYLKLAKNSSAEPGLKFKFMMFVDSMIRSYEKSLVADSEEFPGHFSQIFSTALEAFDSLFLLTHTIEELNCNVDCVLNEIDSNSISCFQFLKRDWVEPTHKLNDNKKNLVPYQLSKSNFSWPVQIYLFLARTSEVFDHLREEKGVWFHIALPSLAIFMKFMQHFLKDNLTSEEKLMLNFITEKNLLDNIGILSLHFPSRFHRLAGIGVYLLIRRAKLANLWQNLPKNVLEYDFGAFIPEIPLLAAMKAFLTNDLWKVKQVVSMWLLDPYGVEVLSEPHWNEVFGRGADGRNYPHIDDYRLVQRILGQSRVVPMETPGELTFFPLKHCRWCGKLNLQPKFVACQDLCFQSDYADKHLFCSNSCKTESLNKKHKVEHERFKIESRW